jgi:methionine-S-sulfoxide reductase
METKNEKAIFGGGCFWCTEAVFSMLKGVLSVMPGYTGGKKENPTYEEVSRGNTGHAEVIEITYNPSQVTFSDLLAVFFHEHDPTQLNAQGNDVGTQYRSAIFYTNEDQRKEAESLVRELQEKKAYDRPVVTEIKPLEHFYPAEQYHKDYYKRNSNAPYCQIIIAPKLEKLQNRFASLLRHE